MLASCALIVTACGDDDADGDSADEEVETEEAVAETTAAPETTTVETTTPSTTSPPTTSPATTEPTETTTAPTESPATTEPDGDESADPPICTPFFAVTDALSGEPDPDEVGALLDAVDANAPDEIAAELGQATSGARTVLETGDFSIFEDPEFQEAITTANTWMFDNCEFVTQTEITAVDYRYEGQMEKYPAGRTAFRVTNMGAEAHELAILRKKDGVDLSIEELLQLPEEEAEALVTFAGQVFVGANGVTADLIVDLEPGDYLASCFIPQGTIMADDGSFVEGTGEPHVVSGMSFEFTVA